VRYVAAQLQQKIPTAILNRTLRDAIERRQPVSASGHRLKFFYATQVRQAPPTFLLFINRDELFSDQYKKYLADQCARRLATKAARWCWCPSRAPKPWSRYESSKHPARATGRGSDRKIVGPAGRNPRR
jgi:hypothetical protein